MSKIKPFISNINWENINFPPQEQDFKTFEINNKSIALNILKAEEQGKISHYYKSQYNKIRENKVILLILTDNNKKHYIFVKKCNALLKKKNKHNACYFCTDCLKRFTAILGFRKHCQQYS